LLLLTVERRGQSDIALMDTAGRIVWLTHTRYSERDATWSPDGARIVFVSTATDSSEIYVMDWTGENVQRLTESNVEHAQPVWSPDGEQIAYTLEGRPALIQFDIFVLDLATGDHRNITEGQNTGFGGTSPSWSPDGEHILYRDSLTDAFNIAALPYGDLVAQIPTNFTAAAPTWSPDGDLLTYAAPQSNFSPTVNDTIYVRRATNPDALARYTIDMREVRAPVWSPDGDHIAFLGLPYGTSPTRRPEIALLLLNPRTEEITEVARVHTNIFPRTFGWSPDGARLAFGTVNEHHRGVCFLTVRTGRQRCIGDIPLASLAWQPR
jgi:Tol biopolymer transport system component